MLKYLTAVLAWLSLVCASETSEVEPEPKRLERWVEYYKTVATGYDVRLKSAPDEPLAVSSKPILVYSNPTIGFDTHGAIFVWTRNGRAEAVGAIWSKKIDSKATNRKNVNHEFHSLANEPLVAKGSDGLEWAPDSPGIEFKLVPDAPAPVASRNLRLAQMREISRQFTGFDSNPKAGFPDEEEERHLRLLPTPIYRYSVVETPAEAKDGKNELADADGAIFGLLYDWDPEILLVIETRPTKAGPRWHYGVAYLDWKPLRVQYKDKDVWKKPEKEFGSAKSKYYLAVGVTTRPAELE